MGKLIGFLVLAGAAVGAWYVYNNYSGGSASQGTAASGDAHGLPAVFSAQSFKDAVAENATSGKPLVVNMSASWCPPCQQMKKDVWLDPKVASWFAANGKVIYVDVDQDQAAANQTKVNSIPTMLIFKSGKEVARMTGGRDAGSLVAWLDKYK